MDSGKLNVKIFSPFETFFEGSAVSVSAKNPEGDFDVLYNHSNFFSLLSKGKIQIDTGFDKIGVQIDSGIMRVNDNKVVVFANV